MRKRSCITARSGTSSAFLVYAISVSIAFEPSIIAAFVAFTVGAVTFTVDVR